MKPSAKTVDQWRRDPLAFVEALTIPGARGDCKFSDAMQPFQRKDFAAMFAAAQAVAAGRMPETRWHFIERCKKCSKDLDVSLIVLWTIMFAKHHIDAVLCAVDADQCKELRKRIEWIVDRNPWVADAVSVKHWTITNKRTGSVATIVTSDDLSGHGSAPTLLVVNELCHFPESSVEFVRTMFDNVRSLPRTMVIVATNAGFLDSYAHTVRENARMSDNWYFSQWSSPAPWASPADLLEAKKLNPGSRYQRLYEGVWTSDTSDCFTSDDIESALTRLKPVDDLDQWCIVAGVDIGIRRDASAIVVAGRHVGGGHFVESTTTGKVNEWGIVVPDREWKASPATDRYRIFDVVTWIPRPGQTRVSLTDVEDTLRALHERWGFSAVGSDPWQAEHICERLASVMPISTIAQTGPQLDLQTRCTLEVFQNRAIDIPDDADWTPQLIADLKSLRLQERPYGFRLQTQRTTAQADGTPHADIGSALSVALPLARDASTSRGVTLHDFLRVMM